MAQSPIGRGPAGGARARSTLAGWTKAFLSELAATSNVSAAARKAKVSTTKAYDLRRANPAFARKWREALCEGYDHLEMELLARLRSGEVKPASSTKRSVRAFDNASALRLLVAHRDTVARERALRDNEDAGEIIAGINAKLDRMREQALARKAAGDGAQDGTGDGN